MFKDGKRGGLAWHQTKMIYPKRAERHWLAIAQGALPEAISVAILWQVSVGGAVDANLPISSVDELPASFFLDKIGQPIAFGNATLRAKKAVLSVNK
jgi:hypothetical protein